MGTGIITNIPSLRAQYALSQSHRKFNTALTRLSTGLRINSPADDVVGMATSSNLMTQIRGMQQAKLNINSASGMMNVAEGYLAQLTDIAQQLRALAVQAADPGLSTAVKNTLQSNFDSLRDEYDRLTDNANYNGVSILGTGAFGSGLTSVIQVGPDSGNVITISLDDTRMEAIGRVAIFTAQTRTATSTSAVATASFSGPNAAITVNDVAIQLGDFVDDGVSNVGGSESAIAYVKAINALTQESGVRATVVANVYTVEYGSGAVGLEANQHLMINGVTVKSSTLAVSVSDDTDASSLVSLINDTAAQTGVSATLDTTNDEIILKATDGRNIHMQVGAAGTVSASYNVFGITGAANNTQMAQRGSFRLEADSAFDIENATNEFTSAATTSVTMDEYGDNAAGTTALSEANLSNSESASYAITILTNVINQLQTRRAEVGSYSNRFDVALRELDTRIENLENSQSAIRDADLAEETANLTKYQIMKQAGITVLSQANTAPGMALSLLKGLS